MIFAPDLFPLPAFFFSFFFFFEREDERKGTHGLSYVVDLTNYFASVSSSRPLQSLVSSLKERESAQ